MTNPPEITTAVQFHLPDHIVALEFNADDDAAAFVQWWYDHGRGDFLEWEAWA